MAKQSNVGIDLENVTGQIKTSLWDLLRDNIYGYLSEGKYSEDRFKSFLQDRSFRVPIDLPGDYGIDLDFNRSDITGTRKDDFRITFKKEF